MSKRRPRNLLPADLFFVAQSTREYWEFNRTHSAAPNSHPAPEQMETGKQECRRPRHDSDLWRVAQIGRAPPDGNDLAFASPAQASDFQTRILNLKTGSITALSDGLLKFPVNWSPTNRLVVVNLAHTKVLAFDFQRKTWSQLLNADIMARNMFDGAASVDGRYMYIETNEPPHHNVIRIRATDGRIETVMKIRGVRQVVDTFEGTTLGVSPNGSVLVTRDVGVEELYSLKVKWPESW